MSTPLRPLLLLVFIVAVSASPARAVATFALEASAPALDPGELVTVNVVVPWAGDAFNGYDAVMRFDADLLEPVLPSPLSAGEGTLFTQACGLRFLDVSSDGDPARMRVSHVVLCAGLSLTGPGTVYTLQFRARSASGIATIELVDETQAYDAGYLVFTAVGAPLAIAVGDVSGVTPAPPVPELRVVPNPFNPSTEIVFETSTSQSVRLEIFDLTGRLVRTLVGGELPAGPHRVRWDGRDDASAPVASGSYLARLSTQDGRTRTRLTLVR